MIPKSFFSPQTPGVLRLLSEDEWRCIGINQSIGWEHYEIHGLSPRARQPTNTDCYRIQPLNLTYSCSGDRRTETSAKPLHPDSYLVTSQAFTFHPVLFVCQHFEQIGLACWIHIITPSRDKVLYFMILLCMIARILLYPRLPRFLPERIQSYTVRAKVAYLLA